MTSNSGIESRRAGALLGFRQLFDKELKAWWGTRRWLVQGLLWTLSLNGLLFAVLFLLPPLMAAQGEDFGDPLVVGGQMFFALGMMAVSVGVVILTQGAVIDERESGVAAWIMSKPVSRAAFILSKVAANALSIMGLMILLPAVVAYLQMSIASEGALAASGFLGALALMILHVLYYLSLTVLLGVVLKNRGAILGISLGVLLGGSLLRSLPIVGLLMPWVLPDIAGAILVDSQALFMTPVIMTAVWTMVFAASSLIAFERVEL